MSAVDLTDRTALVTGAGQGVGLEIARGLAGAGARVWINDLDAERAEKAAASIAAGDVQPVVADVTDADAVQAMVDTTGPVDVLVNNAGVPPGATALTPFVATTPADWAPWLALNVDAIMMVTHAYLGPMQEAGWGRILTIVSDAGRQGEPGQVVYGAAKAAAMGFSRGVSVESGRFGVTANCIALGAIRHGQVAAFFDAHPEAEAKGVRRYPLGRFGDPRDPVGLALVLCSDAGSWITGQVVPVNGGYSHAL